MSQYLLSDILIILSFVIVLASQIYIKRTYNKYLGFKTKNNMSGLDAAKKILAANALDKVYVVKTNGDLTDHYDPRRKVVRLSNNIYEQECVSSVAVAAHECGHALQDKDNYFFMKLRSTLVPIVNLSTKLGYVALLLGIIFQYLKLVWIGIILEGIVLIFQLITLPVEINASKRALNQIKELNILDKNELESGKKVLIAAALTYVASVASTLLDILRLVLIFGSNNKD